MKTMKKLQIISIIVIISIMVQLLPSKAGATSVVQTSGQLWTEGMTTWADSISVSPGQEFKIHLFAGNYSEVPVTAYNVVIKDELPSYPFVSTSGYGKATYVSGSTYYYYDGSGNWAFNLDDTTSPFDGSGLSVTTDGNLSPFESANYKYTVKLPNLLPTGLSRLEWDGPTLDFDFNSVHYTVTNNHSNTISIVNLPLVSRYVFNKTSFNTGDTVEISVTATPGKFAKVQIGSIILDLSETSSGTYFRSYVVPAGVSEQGKNATLYVFNSDGTTGAYMKYTSPITINDTSGSGGSGSGSVGGSGSGSSGGGGPLIVAPPSSAGVSGLLKNIGDHISMSTSSGFVATLGVESNQDEAVGIIISEADFSERQESPANERGFWFNY